MSKITISSPKSSPRLTYTLDFVFEQCLALPYTLELNSTQESHLLTFVGDRNLRFNVGDLLFAHSIKMDFKKLMVEQLKLLQSTPIENWNQLLLFDLIFYLISRYEEYLSSALDDHGRFTALASSMNRAQCIEEPVVDKILHFLKTQFEKQLNLKPGHRASKLISTLDIDLPWYRKHLKFPYYLNKKRTSKTDAYDTYRDIIEIHRKAQVDPIFFFLVDGNSSFDTLRHYKKRPVTNLFKSIAKETKFGIHPSYLSATSKKAMNRSFWEFRKLKIGAAIRSRQHYLRLEFPKTYQLLLQHGIKEDYTMGYADRVGFRAGTARPFYWYDLSVEKVTSLKIIPLIAMDVTLKNYMRLSADQVLLKLTELKNKIKLYGGDFSILWHNNSLSEREGWEEYRQVYFQFIQEFSAD